MALPATELETETIRQLSLGAEAMFGLEPGDVLGDSLKAAPSQARRVAMTAARQITGMSYPQLATAFNRVHHSTIMHALTQAERDTMTMAQVSDLVAQCS